MLAHLKEMFDYYERLEVAELEGDLLKAIIAGDIDKIRSEYAKLTVARAGACPSGTGPTWQVGANRMISTKKCR